MASILKVDTLTGVTTAGSVAVTGEGNSTTTNLQQGLAKAWVKATATVSINDSFNCSSGTDHGTGDYSVTLTNAFNSVQYAMGGMVRTNSSGRIETRNPARDETTALAVEICNNNNTQLDDAFEIIAHGDLA